MSNTLVVTTYDEERYFLEVQVRSIAKYLSPCKLVYIYCDSSNNYTEWLSWFETHLKPLIPHHIVATYDSSHFYDTSKIDDSNEWYSLACMLKIYASRVVSEKDYWDLDSKYFFFKPCTLKDFKEVYPYDMSGSEWMPAVEFHQNKFSIDTTVFKPNIHPYKFDTKICKELATMIDESSFWGGEHFDDVFSYQCYCISKGYELTPGECNDNNSLVTADLGKHYNFNQMLGVMKSRDKNIKVTGIHRRVCMAQLNETTFNALVSAVGGRELIPQSTNWLFD